MQGTTPRPYARTLLDAALGVCLYVLLEWLFFVTKPSFFTVLAWPERLSVALTTALPVLALVMVAWLAMAIAARAM